MKIAITGPESSGKTTLAQNLCVNYGFNYIPEYARRYLEENGLNYKYEDLSKIAFEQFQLISHTKQSKVNVIDSELITIKIWSKYKFGKYDPVLDLYIKNTKIDLFLLLYPDLKWIPDPMRENPHNRIELFRLYEDEMIKNNFKYWVISGQEEQRLKTVSNLLKYKNILS